MNIKNAFDVDIKCIDNLSSIIKQQKGENTWGRTGEALGAGAKIYGYRVDNVHMETYKMLGGLHRTGLNGEVELELIMPHDQQDQEAKEGENANDDDGNQQNGLNAKRKRILKFSDG